MENIFTLEKARDKTNVRRFYNDKEKFSWSFKSLAGYYEPYDRHRLDSIIIETKKLDFKSKVVLDIGCGAGWISKALVRNGFRVVGCDISKELLSEIDKEGLELDLVDVDAGDKLPFGDNNFDLIICSEVIEHIYDNQKTIQEIERVLKPNGFAIITVPNLFCFDSLEGRFGIMTKMIKVINFFKKNPIYPDGYSTHIHKQGHAKWKNLIEKGGLKVKKTKAVFISPYIFEITKPLKKAEIAWYKNRVVDHAQSWLENKAGAVWPLRSLGQSFMFIAENKKK